MFIEINDSADEGCLKIKKFKIIYARISMYAQELKQNFVRTISSRLQYRSRILWMDDNLKYSKSSCDEDLHAEIPSERVHAHIRCCESWMGEECICYDVRDPQRCWEQIQLDYNEEGRISPLCISIQWCFCCSVFAVIITLMVIILF